MQLPKKFRLEYPEFKVLFLLTFFLWLAISCSSTKTASEMTKIVTGLVYDDYGPIAGSGVRIFRTFKGVQTDYDGKFEIEVIEGDILEVGTAGYEIQKIKITKQNEYKIKLKEIPIGF